MGSELVTIDVQAAGLEPMPKQSFGSVVALVLDSVPSAHTKTAYRRALTDFLTWHTTTGQAALNKATVQRYAAGLQAAGLSAANVNQRLSAIRKLAADAADNALLPEAIANGIAHVHGMRQEGTRLGNWLALA